MANLEMSVIDAKIAKEKKEKKIAFTKHDLGKLRWSLLPIKAVEEIIRVLMHGAEKYGDFNWDKCEDKNRYWDACLRHLTAWKNGEKNDLESGKSHLAHAGCCILFLISLDFRK